MLMYIFEDLYMLYDDICYVLEICQLSILENSFE